MDLDGLTADYDLLQQFLDVESAAKQDIFMDNDWLNIIFENRVSYLPIKWNARYLTLNGFVDDYQATLHQAQTLLSSE